MSFSVMANDQLLRMLTAKKPELQRQALWCFLFKNDITPGPTTVWADYTVANYDGASGVPILWDFLPTLLSDGLAVLPAQPCIFTPTGTTTPNSVYGFVWYSTADAKAYLGQRFTGAPRSIGATLDPITIVPQILERSISS